MDQKKQFDRMENMLSDLIKMVGNNNKELQDVKNDVNDLKNDVIDLKNDVNDLKNDVNDLKKDVSDLKKDVSDLKNDVNDIKKDLNGVKKEQAVTNQILTDIRADQDYIWEKAATNERELAKLKRHLQP